MKRLISFQLLTLKLATAPVLVRAISPTPKRRKNKSRCEFRTDEVSPMNTNGTLTKLGVNSLGTIRYTELVSHSISSHVPITVTVMCQQLQTITEAAAGWLLYVLPAGCPPCALHAAAWQAGQVDVDDGEGDGRGGRRGAANKLPLLSLTHLPARARDTPNQSRASRFLEFLVVRQQFPIF